jgi:lipopolysaccharide transport system permease protein
MIRDLWTARYLAWRIFVRDLNARYRQTLLGFLWLFIPPLAVAIGLTLASRSGVISIAATDIPYPVYVVFCMSLWQTFVESVNAPLTAVQLARSVLTKIDFPHEALIVARFGDVLVGLAARLVLIVGVFALYGVSPPLSAFAAIPATFGLIFFGFGIGLLLAPFAALYHDLSRGMVTLLGLWLFATPVVYPVPATGGFFASLVRANPVTPLLVTVRELAVGAQLTFAGAFIAWCIVALLLIFVAWLVYKLTLPFVIERMSA